MVAFRKVVSPAPQPEPASRLKSATRDVSFLRIGSRPWLEVSATRERHVQRYSEVFRLGAEGQGFVVVVEKSMDISLSLRCMFITRALRVGVKMLYTINQISLTFSSHLAFLLLRWKTADTVFVELSFNLQVWRYSPMRLQCRCLAPLPLLSSLR